MLPLIVQHSEALTSFVFALQLALFQPQIRHLLQIVDAIRPPLCAAQDALDLVGLLGIAHREQRRVARAVVPVVARARLLGEARLDERPMQARSIAAAIACS